MRGELPDALAWELWLIHLHADLWPGEQALGVGLYEIMQERGHAPTEDNTVLPRLLTIWGRK